MSDSSAVEFSSSLPSMLRPSSKSHNGISGRSFASSSSSESPPSQNFYFFCWKCFLFRYCWQCFYSAFLRHRVSGGFIIKNTDWDWIKNIHILNSKIWFDRVWVNRSKLLGVERATQYSGLINLRFAYKIFLLQRQTNSSSVKIKCLNASSVQVRRGERILALTESGQAF